METNKNNSNEVKQFAIGTKIEHNGKLYEVLQDKSCNNGYVDKKTFINILQDVQVMLFLITFLLILVEVLELYIFL